MTIRPDHHRDPAWADIVYDDSTPGLEMDRHFGQCHLCPKGATKRITYCVECKHWMCAECRRKTFHRGVAAVKQILWIMGRRDDECCGPIDDETVAKVLAEGK